MSRPRKLATNTSGMPGIRARWRQPRYGRAQLGLDVSWFEDGQRRFTTLPPTREGMRQALALREAATGHRPRVSIQRALQMALEAAQPIKRGRRPQKAVR